MGKNLIEQALEILADYCEKEYGGNKSAMSVAFGMNPKTGMLGKWFNGTRVPSLSSLSPLLERIGVNLTSKNAEPAREVCFVNAKVVPAGECVAPPQAEDYIAAPLVGEVGAGPGYFSEEEVQSWFLVYKHVAAIRQRRDLIAVEIGKSSTSMMPLLHPGDIVLVDRGDKLVDRPGRIMLVRDPDGAGMIKRVSITGKGDDETIQFYSENAAYNPPETYNKNKDFNGDLNNAIVGRVIWAWMDVRDK